MSLKSNNMIVHIEKLVYGGDGLARSTRKDGSEGALLVPFALPGENVEVKEREDPGVSHEVDLVRIIDPSPDRVEPRCAHFGVCGGCHLQHANYETQLKWKGRILEETLVRAGVKQIPNIEVHSAEPWGYRNRIRLHLRWKDARLQVGYMRRRSTDFLPVSMCPIAAPVLWRAAEALVAFECDFLDLLLPAVEVEFFTTPNEKLLQMTLFLSRERSRGFDQLCEKIQETIPELVGAGIFILDKQSSNVRLPRMRPGVAWKADGVNYPTETETYWVSRGSFFQVNRFEIDDLLSTVTVNRRGALAWDLYAGVGLFSRVLKQSFDRVIAVEANASDLVRSFKGPGRVAIDATTVGFLREALHQRERPDLVVMDPPRAGAGKEVCLLLAKIKAKEIVYISCDPTTLGRDLRMMIDSGYRLDELHLVDLFPQTFHQETVAVLRLAEM